MIVRTAALKAVSLAAGATRHGLATDGVRLTPTHIEATNGSMLLRHRLQEPDPSFEPVTVGLESVTAALRDPRAKATRSGVVELAGGAAPSFVGTAGKVPMVALQGAWPETDGIHVKDLVPEPGPHRVELNPYLLKALAEAAIAIRWKEPQPSILLSFSAGADGKLDHKAPVRIDVGESLSGVIMPVDTGKIR